MAPGRGIETDQNLYESSGTIDSGKDQNINNSRDMGDGIQSKDKVKYADELQSTPTRHASELLLDSLVVSEGCSFGFCCLENKKRSA